MKHDFVVGKYTLESLTNGMYSSPLDLYREYIQNAVDSIDDAVSLGLITAKEARIDVTINTDQASLSVRDNGCGICVKQAERTLIDIGNSKKNRVSSRGFRGIGRLAGLGYCNRLTFVTSAKGENQKTTISFDANKLRQLLVPGMNQDDSIYDVIDAVVTKGVQPEKATEHYFEVVLHGIDAQNNLLACDTIRDYLRQNAPLPFSPDFTWGSTISEKLKMNGFVIPEYSIFLCFNGSWEQLYKPYRDTIVSDRIKRLNDNIRDIEVRVLGDPQSPLAILWYASTNFYGTVIDSSIKGLRIRQGNILIGDNSTCSKMFKEERFNGWVIGEIHAMSNGLIANSRRDNFEQNLSYFSLNDAIRECAAVITKELRHLSYARSLSEAKKAVIEAETIDDVNALCVEDMNFACDTDEFTLMNSGDADLEAENDFVNKLSMILDQRNRHTRYAAININDKLTHEQRRVLERVFDVICREYDEETSQKFINTISRKF